MAALDALAQRLAALDGFSGGEMPPSYLEEASELLTGLERDGFTFTRIVPDVELPQSEVRSTYNSTALAPDSTGW